MHHGESRHLIIVYLHIQVPIFHSGNPTVARFSFVVGLIVLCLSVNQAFFFFFQMNRRVKVSCYVSKKVPLFLTKQNKLIKIHHSI